MPKNATFLKYRFVSFRSETRFSSKVSVLLKESVYFASATMQKHPMYFVPSNYSNRNRQNYSRFSFVPYSVLSTTIYSLPYAWAEIEYSLHKITNRRAIEHSNKFINSFIDWFIWFLTFVYRNNCDWIYYSDTTKKSRKRKEYWSQMKCRGRRKWIEKSDSLKRAEN